MTAPVLKTVLRQQGAPARHWVGNGFAVHGMFGYSGAGVAERSPFLLLDYAAPTRFEPNAGPPRGVGQHPHRGFETVTIVYEGEVQHRDSTGAGGVIGKGDVQWMTAGGGILHEEFHSARYSREGGPFEMVQLWVNLPARHKMTPAHYQSIASAQIPAVALPGGAGCVRVIAGAFAGQLAGHAAGCPAEHALGLAAGDSAAGPVAGSVAGSAGSLAGERGGKRPGVQAAGEPPGGRASGGPSHCASAMAAQAASQAACHKGPAATYTPINLWDVRLAAGGTAVLDQPEGWSTLLLVLSGAVQINGGPVLRSAEMATLSQAGRGVRVQAVGGSGHGPADSGGGHDGDGGNAGDTGVTGDGAGGAKLLLLAGQPIDEPVAGYGPFVMNTREEIAQAVADFNSGRFAQARG